MSKGVERCQMPLLNMRRSCEHMESIMKQTAINLRPCACVLECGGKQSATPLSKVPGLANLVCQPIPKRRHLARSGHSRTIRPFGSLTGKGQLLSKTHNQKYRKNKNQPAFSNCLLHFARILNVKRIKPTPNLSITMTYTKPQSLTLVQRLKNNSRLMGGQFPLIMSFLTIKQK